jgi:hypothetical protein
MRPMINLTGPDGSRVAIDGSLVVRARRTVTGENPAAKTRIDWPDMQLVKEPIDEVGPLIRTELVTFTTVTARDGSKIWFNGKLAAGPISLTPDQLDGVVRSAIRLMGYRQYVCETPDEVRAILRAAGGSVLP